MAPDLKLQELSVSAHRAVGLFLLGFQNLVARDDEQRWPGPREHREMGRALSSGSCA